MKLELGKEYIVKVSEEGIITIEEFKWNRFFDIEHDNLDFLTDEEKILIINDVLDKIRAEVTAIAINGQVDKHTMFIRTGEQIKQMTLEVIDKYKAESKKDVCKDCYYNDGEVHAKCVICGKVESEVEE